MGVDSEEFAELGDEFALIARTTAKAGIAGDGGEVPRYSRSRSACTAGT
jgi:hypothetical protein